MSILINQETKVIVQGMTGREGRFHTEQMLAYGTKVVAGVTPGKGGQEVHGVPVFHTVREAMERTQANASVLFVPARFVKDSVTEAIEAGVPLVVTIAEHVPVQDMMFCRRLARDRRSAGGAKLVRHHRAREMQNWLHGAQDFFAGSCWHHEPQRDQLL